VRWTLAKLVGLGVVVAAAKRSPQRAGLVVLQPYFASAQPGPVPYKVESHQSRIVRTYAASISPRGLWWPSLSRDGWRAHSQGRPTIVTTLVVYAGLAFATGGGYACTT